MTNELEIQQVTVMYSDYSRPTTGALVAIGEIEDTENYPYDDRIYFYCQNQQEFEEMCSPDNIHNDDFYFIKEGK